MISSDFNNRYLVYISLVVYILMTSFYILLFGFEHGRTKTRRTLVMFDSSSFFFCPIWCVCFGRLIASTFVDAIFFSPVVSFLRSGIFPAVTLKWLESKILLSTVIAEKDVLKHEKGGFQLFDSDEEPDFRMEVNDEVNLMADQDNHQAMEMSIFEEDNKKEEEEEEQV